MTLEPLTQAGPVIQLHTLAAILALTLGLAQFALPKGTGGHRLVGWVWSGAMLVTCLTAFLIHELRVIGPWSPIHLLALVALASLVLALIAARRGDVRRHRRAMTALYLLALVGAGAFTLWPGRVMHDVFFG